MNRKQLIISDGVFELTINDCETKKYIEIAISDNEDVYTSIKLDLGDVLALIDELKSIKDSLIPF